MVRRSISLRKEKAIHSPTPRARSTERSLHFEGQDAPMPPLIPSEIAESRPKSHDDSDKQRDKYLHHRAMSDPLDVTDDGDSVSVSSRKGGLPTLPRFPVADTHDLNCWSEPTVELFHVRGNNYIEDKKKVPSEDYLMTARGCDLLLIDTNRKTDTRNVGANPCVFAGHLRSRPTFIINFRMPWGVMAHYYEIPERLCAYLTCKKNDPHPSMAHLSPAERTLAKFFLGDDQYRNDRLKLIPYVAAGPWVVRKAVTGKPAIIGTKLPVKYVYQPPDPANNECLYLEADLDIGNSSKAAKRIVSMIRRYLTALTVDVGFVIQGNSEEELPEQMLGAIRIHGLDAMKAPTLCEEQKECSLTCACD